MKDSFVMRTENKVSIDLMSDADAGRLLKAILAHVVGEEIDEDQPLAVRLMLPLITGQIDRASEKYQRTCEQRAEAGRKGGEAKARNMLANASNANQTEASESKSKHTDPDPEPDPVPDPDPVKKEEPAAPRKRFVPPTIEQVQAYVTEHGLVMDCTRFVDWYASKGWKVGSSPMKDWQAAARNWASRDKKETGPPKKPKVDYKAQLMGVDYGDLLRKGS